MVSEVLWTYFSGEISRLLTGRHSHAFEHIQELRGYQIEHAARLALLIAMVQYCHMNVSHRINSIVVGVWQTSCSV